MEKPVIRLSISEALKKICRWCAYQERSHQETRDKLYDYGLHQNEVEQLIVKLIEEGFLNEERFAIAFAGGKFRMLGWGRDKIRIHLKQKRVSDYCIRKALSLIDDRDYIKSLQNIIEKRKPLLKKGDKRQQYYQLMRYALSRGFEHELVADVLKDMSSEE